MSNKKLGMKLQCGIQRPLTDEDSGPVQSMVVWLPERYAVPGKILGIKVGREWQEGWHVVSVFPRNKLSEEHIREMQRVELPSIEKE